MRAERKKKLEAKGWAVGDAKDFLGLTLDEQVWIDVRIALSDALRKTRKQKRLTQVTVARGLGSSQSRVAKMEAADANVSIDLLVRALLSLGLTRKELGRVVAGGRSRSAV